MQTLIAMRVVGCLPTEIYRLTAHHLGLDPEEVVKLADLLSQYREGAAAHNKLLRTLYLNGRGL